MSKRTATLLGLLLVGMSGIAGVTAQEAPPARAAVMSLPTWAAQGGSTAGGDFSSAVFLVSPSNETGLLSNQMPDVTTLGTATTRGEVPYRIASTMTEDDPTKSFIVTWDTSDNNPLIDANAFPGTPEGPVKYLCFEVGGSNSGNVPNKVSDTPYAVLSGLILVYDDLG